MSWFIFILILGYFGFNVSLFWIEHEYRNSGLLKEIIILLVGCFIEAVENFRVVFSNRNREN